jgi:hypothetical protein
MCLNRTCWLRKKSWQKKKQGMPSLKLKAKKQLFKKLLLLRKRKKVKLLKMNLFPRRQKNWSMKSSNLPTKIL